MWRLCEALENYWWKSGFSLSQFLGTDISQCPKSALRPRTASTFYVSEHENSGDDVGVWQWSQHWQKCLMPCEANRGPHEDQSDLYIRITYSVLVTFFSDDKADKMNPPSHFPSFFTEKVFGTTCGSPKKLAKTLAEIVPSLQRKVKKAINMTRAALCSGFLGILVAREERRRLKAH